VDHLVPRSRGGRHSPDNLGLVCAGCNGRKYAHQTAVDPLSGETVPIFNPRLQSWPEHFAWNAEYTEVVGLTPTGRATVVRLDLNRPNLVRYRCILAAQGEHPHPRFLPDTEPTSE
jgi:hypothetical protein